MSAPSRRNRVYLQSRAPLFPGEAPAVRVVDDYDTCTCPWLPLDPATAGSTAEQWVDQMMDQCQDFAISLERMLPDTHAAYLDGAEFDLAACLDRYHARAAATRMDQQFPVAPDRTRSRM